MLTRRELVCLGGASFLYSRNTLLRQTSNSTTITELQKGDPEASYEKVSFDAEALKRLVSSSAKASFEKWDKGLPLRMISSARSFLGASRETTPGQITEFLALFRLPFKDNNGYVPFCAAGLSFCALMAYTKSLRPDFDITKRMSYLREYMPDFEHYYFYPTVSCVSMYHIAAGKNRWIERKAQPAIVPKPGWLVLYDWENTGIPNHCGIVSHATRDKLSTIEFNTSGTSGGSQRNGGTVSEKERGFNYVKGYIVTDSLPRE
jgi:hypothetical protein